MSLEMLSYVRRLHSQTVCFSIFLCYARVHIFNISTATGHHTITHHVLHKKQEKQEKKEKPKEKQPKEKAAPKPKVN